MPKCDSRFVKTKHLTNGNHCLQKKKIIEIKKLGHKVREPHVFERIYRSPPRSPSRMLWDSTHAVQANYIRLGKRLSLLNVIAFQCVCPLVSKCLCYLQKCFRLDSKTFLATHIFLTGTNDRHGFIHSGFSWMCDSNFLPFN